MPLIYCKISFILTWSLNCVIYERNRETITDAKRHVAVVTLSTDTDYNAKLLQQLK